MTDLATFVAVVLSWAGLVGFCTAVGAVVFALVVLRPLADGSALARRACARALGLGAVGALGLALAEVGGLMIDLWALADGGPWPVGAFLRTTPAHAGLARVALGLALGALAGRFSRRRLTGQGSVGLAILAGLLAVNGAWLSHAVSRLDHRELLMALDVIHQAGASVWVGGLVALLACWPLWRSEPDGESGHEILRRFSRLALVAMLGVAGMGLWLALHYVDSPAGLVGTAYGVMIVAKVVLLAAALVLAALNFLAVRRGRPGTAPAPRSRWLVEAETGLAITILVAAASLTAQPPTADVRLGAGRATAREVVGQFTPRWPRITSPSLTRVLVAEAAVADPRVDRPLETQAWSEYNHNIAGLFVLAMGILVCLERTGQARWARNWPLLFLGLAGFLFVRNDPGAWPLGGVGLWASLRDPEILQHRLFVALVVGLGLFEWLVRTGRLRWPRSGFVFPVLCAAGGAILLMHMHGAVESKRSLLIEVTHGAMGVLAAFVGWGRWLELRLSAAEGRVPGWVWSLSLLLVGLILVFYREG